MTELRSAPAWAPGFVHLTEGEAPIPFGFREELEDFVVEEVPRRAPEGEGEHCWILVEKRGVSTSEAIRRLARRLVKDPRDLGFAGRKDARAVARQWISAPGVDPISARRFWRRRCRRSCPPAWRIWARAGAISRATFLSATG